MDLIAAPILLAISFTIVYFLFNFFHIIAAGIFQIRVERFGVFLSLFSIKLQKFKRNHILYTLGLIPITSFVAASGMSKEVLDQENRAVEPYMYVAKPMHERLLFKMLPLVLLFLTYALSIYFINLNNSYESNVEILNSIYSNLYHFFIGENDASQTITNWRQIAFKNNIFAICIAIITIYSTVMISLQLFFELLAQKIKESHVIIQTIAMWIVSAWICYKMIILFFSIYSFTESILVLLTFLATSYVVSFLFFRMIKIMPKNRYF